MLEHVAHGRTGSGEGCSATEGGRRGAMTSGLELWVEWVSEGWEGRRCRFYLMTGRSDLL